MCVLFAKRKEIFRLALKMTVYSHSERSGNEVEESKSKKRARGKLALFDIKKKPPINLGAFNFVFVL